MKTQKQLEQGCGKKLHYNINFGGNIFCGNRINAKRYLCDKCKSLLLQKQEDKKAFMEIIKRIFYKEGKEFPIVSIDRIFELKNEVEEI